KRVICINMGLSDKDTYLKLENRNVKFTRLDQLVKALKLPQVDIIKIDVEGHGLEVILGAIETIKKYRPIIFYEVHNHHEKNTIEALSTLSYQIIEEPGDMYILIPSTKT
ncbi:MAG: FkbM family methyltransferase, partial [Infirmifilum sp.]